MLLPGPAILAINHVLTQAAWARQRLQGFAGRSARLLVFPWRIEFTVGSEGLLERPSRNISSFDVELRLPIDTPLRLLRGREEIMRDARIQGTADFAEALGFVLSRLRWDIEEDLARIVGDMAAHRVVAALGALVASQGQAARNLAEDIAEYVVHEMPMVASAEQVRNFVGDVEALGAALGHLETRLRRLTICSA